ncbi:MAG: tetratricopeptide repeat protein [Pseudomonadota bacterium]
MKPADVRRRSEQLVASGQVQQAGTLIADALKLQPFEPDLVLAKANIMLAGRQYQQAVETLAELIRRKPDNPDAFFLLGNAYRATQLVTEAAKAYGRTLELAPDYPGAAHFLGLVSQQIGDLDTAESAFRAACEQRPELPVLRFRLGSVQHMQGRYAQAANSYRQALRRDATHPPTLTNLGLALIALDEDAEAVEVARQQLAHVPGHTLALANLLYASLGAGDSATVAELLDGTLIQEGRLPSSALDDWAAALEALPRTRESDDDRYTTLEFRIEEQPAFRAMGDALEAMVAAHIAVCRTRTAHPWANHLPDGWTLRLWGESKHGGDEEPTHCHPRAFMSGLAYLSIPPGAGPNTVEFGIGDEAYGGRVPPDSPRIEVNAGSLLLFPAYFFHRTSAFAGEGNRVRIAFDVLAPTRS